MLYFDRLEPNETYEIFLCDRKGFKEKYFVLTDKDGEIIVPELGPAHEWK